MTKTLFHRSVETDALLVLQHVEGDKNLTMNISQKVFESYICSCTNHFDWIDSNKFLWGREYISVFRYVVHVGLLVERMCKHYGH